MFTNNDTDDETIFTFFASEENRGNKIATYAILSRFHSFANSPQHGCASPEIGHICLIADATDSELESIINWLIDQTLHKLCAQISKVLRLVVPDRFPHFKIKVCR